MFKYIRNISFAVVILGILFSAIAATGTPVQAQQVSPDLTEVAQATDIDQTDPDAEPTDPTADPVAGDDDVVPTPEPTCESSISAVGWIICPVIRITFGAFSWLVDEVLEDGLLKINILDDGEEQLRAAWGGFRTLANLIFVIAFFVVIYAEATGRVGALETYSVTRLLPKAALSVIGIQLSFFICAYLISLFNDLGEGVTQLVLAPVEGFSQFELTFTNFGDGTFFGLPIANIGEGFVDSFIGIAAIAAVGWIAYIVFETVLVLALVGLGLMFFTLILRKVLIVSLVVVSPVAFAAWVLPGTDRIFKLWWDSFIRALAMYPLIMLFIASGQLVGRLAVVGDASFVDSIVSMIATFGPLFLIPATFRFAGAAVAGVGAFITNAGNRVKGDVRDPNSVMGGLRNRRGVRRGRLIGGESRTPTSLGFTTPKSLGGREFRSSTGIFGGRALMPSPVRRAYARLPGTNPLSGLRENIGQARDFINEVSSTSDDSFIRAAAVTGGGNMKGVAVQSADGSQWSGRIKLGNHFVHDANGNIVTGDGGVAQIRDFTKASGMRDATGGDFYNKDDISLARKYTDYYGPGFIAASAEYAMSKTDNNNYDDQNQVWYGIDGSKMTKNEKIGYSQGVWYKVKDQGIHHKFSQFGDFYHDQEYDRHQNARDALRTDATTGEVARDTMKVNFRKNVGFMDSELQNYPISNMKAPMWRELTQGLERFATHPVADGGMTELQLDLHHMRNRDAGGPGPRHATVEQLRSLAHKARGLVDETREASYRQDSTQIPTGPDGEVQQQRLSSASSATGSAAREAANFVEMYERYIGQIPGGAVNEAPDFHGDIGNR